MTNKRKVLLIYPGADTSGGSALAEALQRQGAEVEHQILTDNYEALLDALREDVLPVVVKF